MIIDFHTHVFSDKIAERTLEHLSSLAHIPYHTNGTVDGLVASMADAKVDLSITLPVLTKPQQFESVNNFAKRINDNYTSVLSFGGMHPLCEDLQGKMYTLKEMGFKGVKIHPDYQETFFDDENYVKILQLARELDMIVVTHAGVDDGYTDQPIRCTPDRVLNALSQAKGVKLVLAHMGGNRLSDEVIGKLCGLDIYFDTSYSMHEMDKATFNNIVQKHGSHKMLFATDSPWRSLKEELEIFHGMGLSPKDENNILFENALKLLNI